MSPPLPKPLRYLQPFLKSLEKLPPEELNEDVDASRLNTALRKRIRGLDEATADAELAKDRKILESWLTEEPSPAARWILGYLTFPDLAVHIIRPPEPRGPVITFDAPPRWKVKAVPGELQLKKGKVIGSISPIDEFIFRQSLQVSEPMPVSLPPEIQETMERTDVVYGECRGQKWVRRMTAPAFSKQIDYTLSVPDGYLWVMLGSVSGADFDESQIEANLHTLRLSNSND